MELASARVSGLGQNGLSGFALGVVPVAYRRGRQALLPVPDGSLAPPSCHPKQEGIKLTNQPKNLSPAWHS